jgi:formaldehyde-activating enzyme involved in methanogenesis
VSNNVPYINRLNEGHSAQAPAGFVQQAVAKAVADTTRDLAQLGEDE